MAFGDFDKIFKPFWKELTFHISWSKEHNTWAATCTHPNKAINKKVSGLMGLSEVRDQFKSEDDALNMLCVKVQIYFENTPKGRELLDKEDEEYSAN